MSAVFWADRIAVEVISKKPGPYRVYDWWTPSGPAHAGHIRTFLLHQGVYQGLVRRGASATYFYGFDDMDPMDGFPPGLPESWRRYMGQPLSKIPSPETSHKTLADFFAADYLKAMALLDVHPQVPTTTEMYESGQFNPAITRVLDQASVIRHIYAELGTPRPDDWHPFQPICQNCGKIGTTYVFDWDGQTVAYRCEPNLVRWAAGCGHRDRVSPYDGRGKMHWKVEWAAKWWILKTDYEGGGKEHFTKNGSRDYARRIVTSVFESNEPIGYRHEYFLLGGKKMGSSTGVGLTAREAATILPPQVMRFFIYRVPPQRQIEFSPAGETIPRIFDEFDRGLAAITSQPDSPEARATIYAYQQTTDYPVYTFRFSKLAYLIQMPHLDSRAEAQKEKGRPLTVAEDIELQIRVEYARRWLETYAPDEVKIVLQLDLPDVVLAPPQTAYLTAVSKQLAATEWSGETIQTVLYAIKTEQSVPAAAAFGAIYRVFFGRENGPPAGWFLAALDRSFVLARLKEAVKTHA